MKRKKSIKPNSQSVLVIILCAFIGFMSSYLILRTHFLEPSMLPSNLLVEKSGTAIDKKDTVVLKILSADTLVQLAAQPGQTGKVIKSIDLLFQHNPFFLIWSMLIIIMMTIVSGGFPFFMWQTVEIKEKFSLSKKLHLTSLIGSLILISFMSVLPATLNLYAPRHIVEDMKILLSNSNIIPLFVVLPLLMLYPVFHSVFLISPCASKIGFTNGDKKSIEKAAQNFTYLNKVLLNALQFLAAFVVISVLLSSSMRESIKATFTIRGLDMLPHEINYAYGLYFSLFLSIVYFPVSAYLNYRVGQFKNAIQDNVDLTVPDTEKWFSKLFDNFGGDKSLLTNFKVAFTILSPLITSFLPEQLHL